MIIQEIKRLLSNRIFGIVFVGLLIINCLYLGALSYDETAREYVSEYQRYSSFDGDEFLFDLSNTGSQILYQQVNYITDYHDEINQQLDTIDKKLLLGLFSDELVQKSLTLEHQQLSDINQVDTQIIQSYSVGVALKSSLPTLTSIILSFVLLYYLFFQDIEVKGLGLIKSTYISLKSIYWRKLFVLITTLMSFVLCLAGLHLIYCSLLNVSTYSPMQMIVGFEYYPYIRSILSFVIVQSMTRFIVISSFSLIFLAMMLWLRNIMVALMIMFILIICGLFMNLFIPVNSLYVFFKYANYYALIFNEYHQIIYQALFGWIFSIQTILITVNLVVFTLCIVVSNIQYIHCQDGTQSRFRLRLSNKSIHLVTQQLFQSLLVHKGYLIVLAVIVFASYQYLDYTIIKSPEEQLYEQVAAEYYGALDQDILNQLTLEIDNAQLATWEYQELINSQDITQEDVERLNELYPLVERYPALMEIHQSMLQILENGGCEFVNEKGYTLWFSENSSYSLIQNFLLITISVLLFTTVLVRYDFSTKMNLLFQSTAKGKADTIRTNLGVSTLFALLMMLVVYSFYSAKIMKIYPLFDYNYQINSLIMTSVHLSLSSFIFIQALIFGILLFTLITFTYALATRYDAMLVIISISIILIGCAVAYTINPLYSPLFIISSQFLDNLPITTTYITLLMLLSLSCYHKIKRSYNI